MPTPTRQLRLALVPLAVMTLGGPALAQISPFYVGAAQDFTRESNIFRAPDGDPRKQSDTISTTSLLAGIDQPFGRQRFTADTQVNHSRYSDNDQLNNTGYGLKAALDWSTIGRLSGVLSAQADRRLASFNPGDAPLTTEKNIEDQKAFNALFRVGLVTRLSAEASIGVRERDYSSELFDYLEFDQDVATVGVRYAFSGLLTTGVGLRRTVTKYPRFRIDPGSGLFLEDRVKRNDIDLTATWVPTGASTINARISFGKAEHSQADQKDFSGVTGALDWAWRPTGKMRVNTILSRDAGDEQAFYVLDSEAGPTDSEIDTSRTSTSLRTRVNYAATAKIGLNADLRYVRRKLVDTIAVVGGAPSTVTGSDSFTGIGVGATYVPTRTVQLSCRVGRERRTGSPLSLPYNSNSFGCAAQFVLR
jgi:hypothetical protein